MRSTSSTIASATLAYKQILADFAPRDLLNEPIVPQDYGFALADINGDGLVDLVRNHANRSGGALHPNQGGGQLLVNTGTTWKDRNGLTTWQVSAGLTPIPRTPDPVNIDDGSAFVDLNGDGITDLVAAWPTTHAWLNSFEPPVIWRFPHHLAQPSDVSYRGITTAAGRSGSRLTR